MKTGLSEKIDVVNAVLSNFFEERAALELIQRSWAGADYLMVFIETIDSAGKIMSHPRKRRYIVGVKRAKNAIKPKHLWDSKTLRIKMAFVSIAI